MCLISIDKQMFYVEEWIDSIQHGERIHTLSTSFICLSNATKLPRRFIISLECEMPETWLSLSLPQTNLLTSWLTSPRNSCSTAKIVYTLYTCYLNKHTHKQSCISFKLHPTGWLAINLIQFWSYFVNCKSFYLEISSKLCGLIQAKWKWLHTHIPQLHAQMRQHHNNDNN